MSWWVYLEDRDASPTCDFGTGAPDACPKPCHPGVSVPRHEEGGTFALEGIDRAELNITYNYGEFFRKALDEKEGLSWLDGRKAKECVGRLADAVGTLGTKPDHDYWKPTPGNAGKALEILLDWARRHPEAVFRVS